MSTHTKRLALVVLLTVVSLSLFLGSCSLSEKYRPPAEYKFQKHYILSADVYMDDETGDLYLYKPGMGTVKVWNIVEDPPEFIREQIEQGEN